MLREFRKFKGWNILEYFLKGGEKTGIRELARKLKISSMTAKYYCDSLEREGLLRSEKAGTAKLFSLKDNMQTRQWKLAYLLQLINESGLEKRINNPFYVYGSVAKGTWGKESDLDLFILKINEFDEEEVRKAVSKIGFVPSLVVVEFYELDEYRKSHKPLIEEVKKGIYLGDPAHAI